MSFHDEIFIVSHRAIHYKSRAEIPSHTACKRRAAEGELITDDYRDIKCFLCKKEVLMEATNQLIFEDLIHNLYPPLRRRLWWWFARTATPAFLAAVAAAGRWLGRSIALGWRSGIRRVSKACQRGSIPRPPAAKEPEDAGSIYKQEATEVVEHPDPAEGKPIESEQRASA
jgi:hypothetical protein